MSSQMGQIKYNSHNFMKYLLLIIVFLLPAQALAITGDAVRFDFSAGQPSIVDNTTSTCNNTATVMYAFSAGQPAQVFDSTATCTAEEPATGGRADDGIIWFTDD